MRLPPEIDTSGVNEATDLTYLDEQILRVLFESDAPVVTSKEVSQMQGVKSSRRTVHKHLGELEELGLVGCTNGDVDNSPKVWWIPEERIETAEEESPADQEISTSDVAEELRAMDSDELQEVCFDVPGIQPETPRLLRLAKYAFYGGWLSIFLALVSNDLGVPYKYGDWFLMLFLALLVGSIVLGTAHYARSLPRMWRRFQARLPNIKRLDWNLSRFLSG